MCRLAGHQLNSIPEGIANVTAANSGHVLVINQDYSRPLQPGRQLIVFATAKRRMSLARWTKILFYPEMNLNTLAREPDSASSGEFARFGDFHHAEQFFVEAPCGVLLTNRHGKLNVINGSERKLGHADNCSVLWRSRFSSIGLLESRLI